MACEERMQSPESGVSSLLASSGRLHSFLHPQPEHIITYRDKHYSSASAALDAYISDYQQSLGSRTLQLHTHTRTRKDTDVLKSSLTDRELSVLNIPTRRDSDRLSLTTDDLLDLPNDGSLPVTRTSALLTRSESFPVEHSFNSRPCSHLRPTFLKCSLCPPAELDDRIGSLILRAEQMLNSPSFAVSDAVKELNASADTEEALDVDRSWDNPPVAFKSPVPVGIAEEPPAAEDLQRSKSAASGSSGYSSRNHPGPVEALKHMLYRLQAVEQKISQSQHSITDSADTAEQETEAVDAGSGESLLRALHHLERLKTLVDDMNDRKVGAGNDGIDSTDCTRISMHT
ncbi:lung adenoma susceptibility protein 2 isoform X12 [Danio rerio]|uniref:Lung adenoma susceptibility protein 2 isoform X12 n=1 Tax=Danio rerio TaxID=7955 RepID=A0AC58IA42_DANRE